MSIIRIEKYDEVYLRVFSEPSIEQELSDFFRFRVPGYQFSPKFKNKLWDGWSRLYNLQTKKIYVGLLDYVLEFARRNDYEYSVTDDVYNPSDITRKEVNEFALSLNLYCRGKPITVYDYQLDAIYNALYNKRSLTISPTSCLDPDTIIEVVLDPEAEEFLRVMRED